MFTGSSKMIPSSTHTGSRLPVMELWPRIRILGAAPGVEVRPDTATPGSRPTSIRSSDIWAPPTRSAPLIETMELDSSRLSIFWYPVTTTSSTLSAASSIFTTIGVLFR